MADETRESIADIIERFLDNTYAKYEWDDFISIPLKDPLLEEVRHQCIEVATLYPPDHPLYQWCNDEGRRVLRAIATWLRQG